MASRSKRKGTSTVGRPAKPKGTSTVGRPGKPKGAFTVGRPARRRPCYFCKEKIEQVDYKNSNQLQRFLTEKGKIRSRGMTGACRRHQHQIAVAIKRAREMALLPYVLAGSDGDASQRASSRRGVRG